MRHFALSRPYEDNAFGVFPVTRRGCRYASFALGHKISSRLWGCCFVPLVSFDVANISHYFYSCKIFSNKLSIFSEIRLIRSRKILSFAPLRLVDAFHQSLQIVDVFLFHRRCRLDVFLVEG